MGLAALLALPSLAQASALWEGARLPSQGVRREAYWSGTHFTLSCQPVSGRSGLSGEDLDWPAAREEFRRFASAPLSLETRHAVSPAAWDYSQCWCDCGNCKELLRVCPMGAATAMAAMQLSTSVTPASRVANFMNMRSMCSEAEPFVMLFRALPPWPELLHTGWPFFGLLAQLARQMREDGLEEGMLGQIYTQQRRQLGDGTTPALEAPELCGLLGYLRPEECPLATALQLLKSALALAGQATKRRLGSGLEAPIDAIEMLVRRANEQVVRLMPHVPGKDACMQAQNLGLGLSIAVPELWTSLAELQRHLEAWLHVGKVPEPGEDGVAPICPVGGAAWQGEWLTETDLLRDFRAELEVTIAKHPRLGTREAPRVALSRQAWACTLFAGPELPWRQVALHAELIRTLAHSVRKVSHEQRPFIVLTQHTLPVDIAQELQADGMQLEYFDPAPLLLQVPEDRLWQLSWWSGRSLRPTMGQLAIWNLTDYDTVVMLDDDMLMLRPCDELFSLPVFAMSHDPSPWALQHKPDGGVLHRLNNAARVVQPDAALFRSMVETIQSGALKDDATVSFWGYDLQSLEDAYWSRRSARLGTAVFGEGGSFIGCSYPNATSLEPAKQGERILPLGPEHREEAHCVLPAQYNFFVDYKSVFGLVYSGGLTNSEMLDANVRTLFQRAVTSLIEQGSLSSAPKIVHWPGDLRKPWQRVHPRARNAWDEEWWQSHSSMCHESRSPCRIACTVGRSLGAAL